MIDIRYSINYAVLIFIMLYAGSTCYAQRTSVRVHPDEHLYENLFTIAGKMEILNHPTLGRIPASNEGFLLQRIGCKPCVVGVITDNDGNYSVTVGRGKYRVINREGFGGGKPSFDRFSPKQQRIVDASKGKRQIQLNLEIVLPSETP